MTREEGGSIDEVPLEAGIGSVRESKSRINSEGEEDGRARQFACLIAPIATTVSAGLYLFDFVSNIFVLKEYWDYYRNGNYHGYKDLAAANFTSKPFFMCLALMICGHIGTVIAFKLKLPPEQNPLSSAYFLPLIQFRRFVQGLIRTGSFAGYSGPSKPIDIEAEALYAMVSAAIETGPQVALQFLVIVVVSRRVGSKTIPLTLLISLIASFLSGIYNTGRAVMFKLSRRWTVILNDVGILAGLYTGGALLLRTVTIASIMNYWIYYFKPGFYTYIPCWLLGGSYIIGLVCVSAGRKLLSWSGQLHAMVSGYVNFTLGPLYPLVDGYSHRLDQDQTSPRQDGMKYRLGLAAGLNLLLDVIPLIISGFIQQNPCNYHLAPGEGIEGTLSCTNYLAYLIAGALVSIVMTLFLVYLLHSVQKQERTAAVCDDPSRADSESSALDEDNQERPFCPSSREFKLGRIVSDTENTVSPQPPSISLSMQISDVQARDK